ncbi:hypothetical protein, partial [Escherichia coli]
STSKTPSYTKSVSWQHHRFCEQNMAKFKVPSYLEIRKDLPRNCSGKIIRKNLK